MHIYIYSYIGFGNRDREQSNELWVIMLEIVSVVLFDFHFLLWQPNSNQGSLVLSLGHETLPWTGSVLCTCPSSFGVSHHEWAEEHDETYESPKLRELTGKNYQGSLAKERLLGWLVQSHWCQWEAGHFSSAWHISPLGRKFCPAVWRPHAFFWPKS